MAVNLFEKIKNQKWFSIYLIELLAVLLIFGLGSLTIHGFFSWQTVVATLVIGSFLGIAAGGQTIVIILGAIDLSIPSIMSAAVTLGGFWTGHGWPFYAIVTFLVGEAIIIGCINALVSKKLNIQPMITTLATGAIVRGITSAISHGYVEANVPIWVGKLSALNGHMGPIPLPPIVGIWALYTIIILLLLFRTTWGRRLYASGVNDRAAQLALVNTTWVWVSAFVLSSVTAVLAGILLAGFAGSGYADTGAQYLFLTVGAVVLGGTATIGGRGGYGQTVFGALIMTLIGTITIGFGLNSAAQQIVLGIIIVGLMALYGKTQNIRLRM